VSTKQHRLLRIGGNNFKVEPKGGIELSSKKIQIKAFLLNKKERFEDEIVETGIDSRKDEVKSLIKKVAESEEDMYGRRKNIRGFDFIMAEGKIHTILKEAIESYILGNFFATIALSSMTAERLCYDFIDFVEIRVGKKLLSNEQKQELNGSPATPAIRLNR
jgi:hypothetical protein